MPLRLALALLLAGTSCSSKPPMVDGCDAGLDLDDRNCGTCGHVCGDGQACAAGTCQPKSCAQAPCADFEVCAAGVCTDRACVGVTCQSDEACSHGQCFPVGCSGMTCDATQVCANGACIDRACAGVICPAGQQCHAGVCASALCTDHVKDGSESDVDCGPGCPGCIVGKQCMSPSDCASNACIAGRCVPAGACSDHTRDGRETDLDCGGGACDPCGAGLHCTLDLDCTSGVCTNGVCGPGTCTDRRLDGRETDVDCGGNVCDGCIVGRRCSTAFDCASGQCVSGFCVASPACGTDCGHGTCVACAPGKPCLDGRDCESGVCGGGVCAPGTCVDGAKNGAETDVDCGGTVCAACRVNGHCVIGPDCSSGICTAGVCVVGPTCSNGMQDGHETDRDCGGPDCLPCGPGKKCGAGEDCDNGSCPNQFCAAGTCTDGMKNGVETDIDCGGAVCPRCDLGGSCNADRDCLLGACNRYSQCSPTHQWTANWHMPDSVQPFCTDGMLTEIPCPTSGALFGQDGCYQRDVPTYTTTADTVTDSVTHLEWQRVANLIGLTWRQSVDYCAALTLAGKSDWRMPSLVELASINSHHDVLYVDSNVFTYPVGYAQKLTWSGSELKTFQIAYGTAQGAHAYADAEPHETRCVRGGTPAPPTVTYAVTPDTVTDPFTGLMWQRNPPVATMTWQSALATCEGLSLGGFTDWRVPNLKELYTVIDTLVSNGVAAPMSLGLGGGVYYWSGTIDRNYFQQAFSVNFHAPADVDSEPTGNLQRVMCVR